MQQVTSSERRAFWVRTGRLWDVFFYVMLGIAVPATLVGGGDRGEKAASVACLLALVVAYTLIGRRARFGGHPRLAQVYLVVLVVITTVQVGYDQLGAIILFVAYSQIWYFAQTRRWAVIAVVVLSAAVATRLAIEADRLGDSPLTVLSQMAVGLTFAIVLGLWITQIAEKSEERASLLEQLEAAQAEVAASHHAAGVLAERERMAQEIHDTLAQGFTSVVMLAQTTAAELDRGRGEAARERVTQIEQVARDNLAEARALVAAFGPADLADATLGEALARLAQRFDAETGVRVVVDERTAQAAAGLGRDTQVVLLRAAQEALANVRRHAGASSVTLALVRDGESVRLDVTDDGRGIGPDAVEGHGLRGMRERARSGGGDLAVEGAPGGGTRVALSLPAGGPASDEGATP